MAAAPDRYELHFEDETHLDTNPYLSRVWHRVGQQPTLPAVGTNRRLTVFRSVEALGRGRIEVVQARQGLPGTWPRLMPATKRPGGRSSWCWTTDPAMSASAPKPRWLRAPPGWK